MKEYYDYGEWVTRVLRSESEFSYRYIYDAYSLAKYPFSSGLYYVLETRTTAEGKLEYGLQNQENNYALILQGDQGRDDFVEYLIQRFCPDTRDMEAWHNKRHDWYVDDLDDWVDKDGNPFRG